MRYFKGLSKRLLYVMATVVNWVIYIPTLLSFLTIETCGVIVLTPILWILIGSKNLEILAIKIFGHSNDELWWKDRDDDPSNFISLWPLWGPYVQKHYLNKLIKDETNIQ